MNHCVPDFEMDDDYSLPTSSGLSRPKRSALAEDDVMELLWQNGQVVMQSQNQRWARKSPPSKFESTIPAEQSVTREIRPPEQEDRLLFLQEDEMASWLHYPLVDDPSLDQNFCADFLYPPPPQCLTQNANTSAPIRSSNVSELRQWTTATAETSRPPIPPTRRSEPEMKVQNFVHFSRFKPRMESGPSSSKTAIPESTVVDSSVTPAVRSESRASEMVRKNVAPVSNNDFGLGITSGGGVASTSSGGCSGGSKEMTACEVTVSSSPGGSSASAEPASQKPVAEDRKRKGKETEDTECQSEDVEFESAQPKKKRVRGSTSTKRSRAAEVHNLSERRRRDRINEKMRALQELIPRCNKSDKASMLDEAIEYLKSLQLQVQMMSMGCGMVPMMFPAVQQFMPPMGMGMRMGMGMGMGMGMDMSMARPMMPFPNVLTSSALPRPPGAAHLGPSFLPAFHMMPVPNADPSRIQSSNHSDHMVSSLGMQNMSHPRIPGVADAYQQFLGLHQMQLPQTQLASQNHPPAQPTTRNPCADRSPANLENNRSG